MAAIRSKAWVILFSHSKLVNKASSRLNRPLSLRGGAVDEKLCPYLVLGIPERSSASADDIRAAYLKMALRWHPDKNPGRDAATAERRFKEIQRAYDILSDPRARALYDASAYDSGNDSDRSGSGSDSPGPPQPPSRRPPRCDDPAAVRMCGAAGAFRGYAAGDPAGFYHVYGATFRELAAPERGRALPEFGGPASPPSDVQ